MSGALNIQNPCCETNCETSSFDIPLRPPEDVLEQIAPQLFQKFEFFLLVDVSLLSCNTTCWISQREEYTSKYISISINS